ncbi:MAG: purine-nucleoside phosphorylase [Candidatus Omnitrophica bacterium]|nr:purine-nucleoside phosphorylase [Candidatus Omnitrophota bacterium]
MPANRASSNLEPRTSNEGVFQHPVSACVQETVAAIRSRVAATPRIGIILGTGLAKLLGEVRDQQELPYPALPHMPVSTAPTHRGQLVFGQVGRTGVVVMDGRFHLYEGYSAQEVVYPVRVLRALGVDTLLVSNVAGGLNPDFSIGELMLITDHINLLGMSPLVGPNDERIGPRFPDMSRPYDARLLRLAEQVGSQTGLPLRRGVYAAMLGPQLETRAEYRWLRATGADAVGMSTVPEVIAAIHAGMRVLAVSLISDMCIPETLKPVNIEEIIAVANRAEPLLTKLMTGVIRRLDAQA